MDSVLLGRSIDAPLDARGAAQARAVAERLASFAELLIQCSPRLRTRQTAAAIAQRRGDTGATEVEVVPDLDEIDFGSWSGQPFAALARDAGWRRWNEQRGASCTPAGDTIAAVQARAMAHLQQLQQHAAERTAAIVTHAEVIRSLVLHAMDAPADQYHNVVIAPASLTTLSIDGAHLKLTALNEQVSP